MPVPRDASRLTRKGGSVASEPCSRVCRSSRSDERAFEQRARATQDREARARVFDARSDRVCRAACRDDVICNSKSNSGGAQAHFRVQRLVRARNSSVRQVGSVDSSSASGSLTRAPAVESREFFESPTGAAATRVPFCRPSSASLSRGSRVALGVRCRLAMPRGDRVEAREVFEREAGELRSSGRARGRSFPDELRSSLLLKLLAGACQPAAVEPPNIRRPFEVSFGIHVTRAGNFHV